MKLPSELFTFKAQHGQTSRDQEVTTLSTASQLPRSQCLDKIASLAVSAAASLSLHP